MRLIVGVCGLVLVTGISTTWLAHRSALGSTEVLTDAIFREVSEHAVTHTRAHLLRATPIVDSLTQLAEHGLALDDRERLADQLLLIFVSNPGLSWLSFADETGTFTGIYAPVEGGLRINQSRIEDGHTRLIEYDVLPDGSRRLKRKDGDSGYDPRNRPFYKKAKEKRRLVWLPPYVFFNQGVPGTSCAAPVIDAAGQLRGVFSIDFDLQKLSQFVAKLKLSEHSTIFLFTTDDVLLAHPSQRMLRASGKGESGHLLTLKDIHDPVIDAYRQQLRAISFKFDTDGSFHFFDFSHGNVEYLASATSFHVGDDLTWVVGAIAPKTDFVAGVWRSQALALAVAGVALVVALFLAAWLARRVSDPVLALTGFMSRVGGGDLDSKAQFGSTLEFQELSEALNRMIGDLRDRVRLRHSLDIAMQVQQRLLPSRPPEVAGLDIAGHSTYCDETGGDYYDFLLLDQAAPHQILVAIGDVMGHGVAAALVMAGARAVLRDRAASAGSLTDLIGRLNRLLTADHEGERFMTMHLAIVDAQAHTYCYISAGHDAPLVYHPVQDRFDDIASGELPLGIDETHRYSERTLRPLDEEQVIVIGTDGVWEMPNAEGQQFGKDNLRQAIRDSASLSAQKIAEHIRDRLSAFRGKHRAVDDVTFVVVKVLPQQEPRTK